MLFYWLETLAGVCVQRAKRRAFFLGGGAVLSGSNQMNNQDKRRRQARNQLLVTFSQQQSNPDAVSVVSGREPSSVTLRWRTNSLDFLPGRGCGLHHLAGVLWAQLWLKATGLTQFGPNQDGMVGKMERGIQTFHSLIKRHIFISSVLRVWQKSTLCKANQGWNCLKGEWGDQYTAIRWSLTSIAP